MTETNPQARFKDVVNRLELPPEIAAQLAGTKSDVETTCDALGELAALMRPVGAVTWLQTPRETDGGLPPIELTQSGHADQIRTQLGRIKEGISE